MDFILFTQFQQLRLFHRPPTKWNSKKFRSDWVHVSSNRNSYSLELFSIDLNRAIGRHLGRLVGISGNVFDAINSVRIVTSNIHNDSRFAKISNLIYVVFGTFTLRFLQKSSFEIKQRAQSFNKGSNISANHLLRWIFEQFDSFSMLDLYASASRLGQFR